MNKLSPLLLVLLVAASAAAGAMYTKAHYLEQKQVNQPAQQAGVLDVKDQKQKPPQAPTVAPLDNEQWQKITQPTAAVKGNSDAPVTIVEFSEYQCPFCKRYVDETYDQIMSKYGDKIYYVFHDLPLSFHNRAQIAAEAARCAGAQNNYWDYHDILFDKRSDWVDVSTNDIFTQFAQQIGINATQFKTCLSSGKFTQSVKDDLSLASQVGATGTPTFFINGQKLVGAQPFEKFAAIIDKELEK